MSNHAIVHVEFSARDLNATGRFYSELFGWKVESIPEMNYATFAAGSGPGGGFTPVDGEMVKPGDMLVYVSTDDVDATLAHAERLGGKTLRAKTEIPGIGWFGVFQDPNGNQVALFTGMKGSHS